MSRTRAASAAANLVLLRGAGRRASRSIAPPTLKRSVMALPMSALPSTCSRVSPASRRTDEARRTRTSSGNSARHSRVTCQLSASMAMPTTTTAMTLADRAGQRARERPLRTDHVVVEPGDQGAGLGAGEERDRLALDVVEDPGAQVEDQALADPRRQPAAGTRRARRWRTAKPAMARASTRSPAPESPSAMPLSSSRCTSSGVTTTVEASMTVSTRKTAIRTGADARTRGSGAPSSASIRLSTTLRSDRRWRHAMAGAVHP